MAGFIWAATGNSHVFGPWTNTPNKFFSYKKLKIYNFARIYGPLWLPWQDLSAKEKWIFSPVYFSFWAEKFCHFCEEGFSHRWQFITFELGFHWGPWWAWTITYTGTFLSEDSLNVNIYIYPFPWIWTWQPFSLICGIHNV